MHPAEKSAIIYNLFIEIGKTNIHSKYYIWMPFKKSQNPRGHIFCKWKWFWSVGSPDYYYSGGVIRWKFPITEHRMAICELAHL